MAFLLEAHGVRNSSHPDLGDNSLGMISKNPLAKKVRLHCLPGALLAGFLVVASLSASLVGDFDTPADHEGGVRVWAGPAWQSYAVFTGDFFANLQGGNETGGVWTGLLEFGINVDLERQFGWAGTSFHIGGMGSFGDDPSEKLTGDFNTLNNIAAYNTVRLRQVWLQRELAGEHIVWRLGQIAVDDDFMISERSQLFINSAFNVMPTESGNIAAPIWPLGALGVLARVQAGESSYVQFGIYDGDAGREDINNDGLHYALNRREGLAFFFEGGLQLTPGGLPGDYKAGGFYHSGDFEDFGSGATRDGNWSMYFVIDQALALEVDNEQGLGAFFHVGYSPQAERNSVTFYTDLGLTYVGLLPGRPADAIGLAFSYTKFGNDYRQSILAEGGIHSRAEKVIELTWQAPLFSRYLIQPDLQIILDPAEGRSHAVLLGLRFHAEF